MTTVVQQDHTAAGCGTNNLSLDVLRRGGPPVKGGDVPHDRFQPERARDSQCHRTPAAKGWTKQLRMLADRVLQRAPAILDLHTGLQRRLQREVGMAEGMVPNHVPG